MHELPPLIHRERDRMIDVHHAILPLTARPKPDMEAMIEARVPLADGLFTLSPPDMIVHAAAHLFADGDLAGGLRNLWDIDRLLREFGGAGRGFLAGAARIARHATACCRRSGGRPPRPPASTGPPLIGARHRFPSLDFKERLLAAKIGVRHQLTAADALYRAPAARPRRLGPGDGGR